MTASFHTPLDICWCRLQSQVLRFFQVAYLNNLLLVCCDICRHISKGPFECTSLDSEKTEPTFLLLPQSLVFPSLSVVRFLHAKLEYSTAVCFCWRLWWVCPAISSIYHSTTRSTACSSHVAITSTTCNNHTNDFSTACYSTVWSYTSMPTSSMACMPTVTSNTACSSINQTTQTPATFQAIYRVLRSRRFPCCRPLNLLRLRLFPRGKTVWLCSDLWVESGWRESIHLSNNAPVSVWTYTSKEGSQVLGSIPVRNYLIYSHTSSSSLSLTIPRKWSKFLNF